MAPLMTVPETAINKDHGFETRKNDIGLAGKVFTMKAVPEASFEQLFPEPDFRFGVLTFDGSHIPAARFAVVDVGHLPRRLWCSFSVAFGLPAECVGASVLPRPGTPEQQRSYRTAYRLEYQKPEP